MQRLFNVLLAIALLFTVAACSNTTSNTHSHGDGEEHAHGPDTHTHDDVVAADTAGTYVDSTATFFSDGEGHDSDDHVHGPDTHTHDNDAPGHN